MIKNKNNKFKSKLSPSIHSRYITKTKHKPKSKSFTQKTKIKSKKNQNDIPRTRKRTINFIGGGEILDTTTFISSLTQEQKNKIKQLRDSEMTNQLDEIKGKYRLEPTNTLHLYDFIYQNNNEKKLIKIWDHGTKDPESITAGLHGIHIYVIIENTPKSKIFEIIGKFIRQ